MSNMTEYPRISLEAARVNAGLTQREAAKAISVSLKTLQNYEAGRTVPDWNVVKRIEEAYSFPAGLILFASENG